MYSKSNGSNRYSQDTSHKRLFNETFRHTNFRFHQLKKRTRAQKTVIPMLQFIISTRRLYVQDTRHYRVLVM